MRKLSMVVGACMSAILVSAPVFAQNASAPCGGAVSCAQGGKAVKSAEGAKTSIEKKPSVGGSARSGSLCQRSSKSSLKAAPKGQEYRVVSGYVVLANKSTHKIVQVIGPKTSLAK